MPVLLYRIHPTQPWYGMYASRFTGTLVRFPIWGTPPSRIQIHQAVRSPIRNVIVASIGWSRDSTTAAAVAPAGNIGIKSASPWMPERGGIPGPLCSAITETFRSWIPLLESIVQNVQHLSGTPSHTVHPSSARESDEPALALPRSHHKNSSFHHHSLAPAGLSSHIKVSSK